MPRHDKEGTTMPRKVTAKADLTAIGCQIETTATAAEKEKKAAKAGPPDEKAMMDAVSCSGIGGFVALLVAVGVAADVKHLKLNRKRVPDSLVLADVGEGR